MREVLVLLLLAGGLVWPPGLVALAQVADPAAGLNLRAERYRALVGRPPAQGSAAEAEDLAVLNWNLRSRYPEGVLHSWRFLYRNISTFDAAVGADLSKAAPNLFQGLPSFFKRIDAVKDALKDEIARPRPYVGPPE